MPAPPGAGAALARWRLARDRYRLGQLEQGFDLGRRRLRHAGQAAHDLQTQRGQNVLGEGGTITLPPDTSVTIAKDGTISAVPNGNQVNNVQVIGRLKLVNPEENSLTRGDDGLFRTKGGVPADADPAVNVAGGMLENSNVNVVESMVTMINLARSFEMQMKLIQNAENNETKAAQILSLS